MMITKETIGACAEMYFEAAKDHLESLRSIQEVGGNYDYLRSQIELFIHSSGLSAADMLRENYDSIMLKNDEFVTVSIIYACTCIFCGSDDITMPEFREYLNYISEASGAGRDNHDLIKYFSNIIEIDPSIVPEYVKNDITETAEEREAEKICEKEFEKLDGPGDYASFELYFDYVKNFSKDLINKLNGEGFAHTYDLDILTQLLILKKIGFPTGHLYSVKKNLPVPRGLIDVLTKRIFSLIKNGGVPPTGGDIIDLSRDIGDL